MVPPPSPYRHPHPHPLFPQKNVSDSTLKPQDSSLGNDVEEKAANQSSKTRDFFLKLRQALTFHHSAVKHSKTPLATLIRQQTAPFKEKNKMMKKGGGTGEDRNAFVYRGGFGSVIVLKNIDLSSSSAASAFSLESTAPALLSSSPLSPVVVKVLSRSTRERWADFHDRVEREVDCQSAVKSHPNIISPPHLVFWGGKMKRRRAYIVMDRIIGHNLDFEMIDARLASGMEGDQLPKRQCFLYFSQLIQAIFCLHSHLINHRDIKPANIMIDSTSGFLKLIDFGSAVHVVKDRGVKLAHLTDFWSAPETRYQHTLLDSQESLLKSDIYSAALIFLTMYHGFAKMDEWTTIYSRRFNRSHPALSNIIEEPVRNVLLLMVDFNPDKRPSAAELLTEQDWIQSGKIPAITNSLIIPYGVPPPPIAPRPKRNSTL